MTTNVTKLEENKVRLDVEVTPETVRQGVEAKIRELGRQVRVPGFRPGKAPRRVIENRLGRDYIYMEALQEQLPGWYSQAVVETDVRPIDQPEYTSLPLARRGFISRPPSRWPPGRPRRLQDVEFPGASRGLGQNVEYSMEELRGQLATLAAIEERPSQRGLRILDFSGERLTAVLSRRRAEATCSR